MRKRLLFVTGKGGVGKTTFCAALGLRAANTGLRVLLCEVSSAPAFGRIFGGGPVGFEPVSMAENLWAANCDAKQCLVSFLERFVKVRRLARALVRNRITGHFLEAAPGVLETVVLERISQLSVEGHGEQDYDLVLVDLPSTGHALTFLECPRTLARVLQTGRLSDYLHALAGRLANPALSELVLVTVPEEMPVEETVELWHAAHERLELPLETVVINRVRDVALPPSLGDALLRGAEARDDEPLELQAARLIARWSAREQTFIDRLEARLDARLIELPWVAEHDDERELVQALLRARPSEAAA